MVRGDAPSASRAGVRGGAQGPRAGALNVNLHVDQYLVWPLIGFFPFQFRSGTHDVNWHVGAAAHKVVRMFAVRRWMPPPGSAGPDRQGPPPGPRLRGRAGGWRAGELLET
jgi:hypothetical protein